MQWEQFKTENEAWEAKRAELERDCQSLQTKRAAHSGEWESAFDHKQETLHKLIDHLANSQSPHSKEYERIDVVIAALGDERSALDAESVRIQAADRARFTSREEAAPPRAGAAG